MSHDNCPPPSVGHFKSYKHLIKKNLGVSGNGELFGLTDIGQGFSGRVQYVEDMRAGISNICENVLCRFGMYSSVSSCKLSVALPDFTFSRKRVDSSLNLKTLSASCSIQSQVIGLQIKDKLRGMCKGHVVTLLEIPSQVMSGQREGKPLKASTINVDATHQIRTSNLWSTVQVRGFTVSGTVIGDVCCHSEHGYCPLLVFSSVMYVQELFFLNNKVYKFFTALYIYDNRTITVSRFDIF